MFQFEEEDQVVIVEVDGRVERVDMMAEKLDAMMELMFSFIDQVNTGDEEDMNGLFETLMRIFEASILVTHKSKYVQFLLFYACHINKFYAETFLSRLLHKLFDASNSEIHRWSCGCYLGSFIARATCIEDQTLQTVLDLMISWLFSYLERVGDNAFPDPNVHMVFYTVFQSICYIICYKADFFRTSEHGLDFLHQFRWDRIIESALNPLKVSQLWLSYFFFFLLLLTSSSSWEIRAYKQILPTKKNNCCSNFLDSCLVIDFFPLILLANFSLVLLRWSCERIL